MPTRQAIAGIAAQNSAITSIKNAFCLPARILHPLKFLTQESPITTYVAVI